MCPTGLLLILALCPLGVFCQATPNLVANFNPEEIEFNMLEEYYVNVIVSGTGMLSGDEFTLRTSEEHIATATWNSTSRVTEEQASSRFEGRIRIHGHFIGRTPLTVENRRGTTTFPVNGSLPIVIVRPQRVIDRVFTASVATFVSLIFINFGCAMHWPTVKSVLKRPVGPAIGMLGQFLFMPLMSFGIGFLIFPNQADLRLGMFVTGVAPGGGASNIWTFILGGNLNLSLAMTSISTLASFGFMPAWLFSLGQVVFGNADIVVPYRNIATFVVGLIVPLFIGLGMQKWTPRLAGFMVRILKGFSTLLLLFIIIFAIITNLYIFELFTWQIIIAGMGIPWLGYIAGYLAARLLRQPHPDALAISIETGIQNTGIAIFLLRTSLPQPEADITTVVPVSAAIMTPFPMMAIYAYQRISACIRNRNKPKDVEEITPTSGNLEANVIAAADEVNADVKQIDDTVKP